MQLLVRSHLLPSTRCITAKPEWKAERVVKEMFQQLPLPVRELLRSEDVKLVHAGRALHPAASLCLQIESNASLVLHVVSGPPQFRSGLRGGSSKSRGQCGRCPAAADKCSCMDTGADEEEEDQKQSSKPVKPAVKSKAVKRSAAVAALTEPEEKPAPAVSSSGAAAAAAAEPGGSGKKHARDSTDQPGAPSNKKQAVAGTKPLGTRRRKHLRHCCLALMLIRVRAPLSLFPLQVLQPPRRLPLLRRLPLSHPPLQRSNLQVSIISASISRNQCNAHGLRSSLAFFCVSDSWRLKCC
jgi:hypothetical protein